jgi:hypothetical protein
VYLRQVDGQTNDLNDMMARFEAWARFYNGHFNLLLNPSM